MRKTIGMAVALVLAAASAALARPVDQTGTLDRLRYLDPSGRGNDAARAVPPGVLSSAAAGTTFYGGTFWAADSARWEALQGQLWTFDSGVGSSFVPPGGSTYPGVDPNKAAGLHQTMEGWVGFDKTFSQFTYFRRLGSSDPRWSEPGNQGVCVGSAAGLGGSYSMWAGVFADEAREMCYAARQGYGNNWNICIGKTFAWSGGQVSLSFAYRNDTEPGYDYSTVVCDTSGGGDEDVVLASYDGPVAGTANLTLLPGVQLPVSGPKPIVLKFCANSDGGYSDQDGGYATSCGAFAIDNVVASGGISENATFETDNNGWLLLPAAPGLGGEWSDIVDIADLPPQLTPCTCALQDSVLLFQDLGVGGHGLYQNDFAASPWIDLGPDGYNDQAPGKVIRFSVYAEQPLLNYIFAQFNAQWYPDVCLNNGKLITSNWTSDGFVYFFGGVPTCTTVDNAIGTQLEFSSIIPNAASQVRIALGVITYCRFFANCTGSSNHTPVFDDVALGVYGNPNAPYIAFSEVDTPQDNFPENGTLNANAPGRLDCNNIKGSLIPEVGTSLGDTLIVNGAVGGAEVWVDFAVSPGPGVDAARLSAWLGAQTPRGTHDGQTWYTARMDTAEQGMTGPVLGTWMTAYHESDPHFTGTDRDIDPGDLDPNGQATRLGNDIFPDDLFTPGTRVNMFYRSKYVAAPDLQANWFMAPDTSGGVFLEWECLPSSTAPDGQGGFDWNCLLYVDHFDTRGAQPFIEAALGNLVGFGSSNFEGTNWDRYDVRAASSEQASFGRPLRTEYGASVVQALAYTDIIWNSGNLNASNLVKEDGDVLLPWLTLPDFGANDLYLSGDGIVSSPILESTSEPSANRLISDVAGLTLRCNTFRSSSCPTGGAGADNSPCVDLAPVSGAPVAVAAARSAIEVAQGNGCPQLRSFDVIGLGAPDRGSNHGDEDYMGTKSASFASAATDAGGADGLTYRIVVDGVSLHYRRDAGTPCDFNLGGTTAVTERLGEVLTYMGLGLGGAACSDPTAGTGIPVNQNRQPTFRTGLADFSPNPLLTGATGRIRFTLAREGKARIDIYDVEGRLVKTVFDGLAAEGVNNAFWNGTDGRGRQVANGVYFYRLHATDDDFSKKMVVVRNGGN